jgi:hypothetical protein
MKYGIVVTTIFDGSFLEDYYRHFQAHGVLEQFAFYVVGDLSTPELCRQRTEQLHARGLPWHYLGQAEQESFLQPFPELAGEIPWKSDNRRNVGFLKAYADGCDIIVAIDDDNYPKPRWPFHQGHAAVGQAATLPVAAGHNGWFNLCSLMRVELPALGGGQTVYARGFPYQRRDVRCGQIGPQSATGTVGINVGLWSGDPDVDAATRLVTRCEAREDFATDCLLGDNVLMPINTQNTALLRAAVPAYYYVRMGHPVGGMKLDRFGDIFSGFFVQKCARAVGHRVRLGAPVVDHRRSPHNLYKDLWNELAGMVVIDDMLPLLEAPLSPAPTYSAAMLELVERLERWAVDQKGFLWDEPLRAYFRNVAANVRLWVTACGQLDGGGPVGSSPGR